MLRTITILALCASASTVQAWQTDSIEVMNSVDNYSTSDDPAVKLIREAAVDPNATVSVPLLLGNANVTFRVNVTDLALPGIDIGRDIPGGPRGEVTTYDISWGNGTSWSDVVNGSADISWMTFIMGSLDAEKTKGDVSDGDCTNALGPECVAALKNGLGPGEADQRDFFNMHAPEPCEEYFGPGTYWTRSMINGSDDDTSPVTVYVNPYLAFDAQNIENKVKTEERLHFMLFRDGSEMPKGYPVCARVSATSGALSGRLGMGLWLPVAVASVAVSMLL